MIQIQDIQCPKFFPPGVALPPLLNFIYKITQNLRHAHAPGDGRKSMHGALRVQGLMVNAAVAANALVMSDSVRPPWTTAHQDPPSLGFSRQEHWSGLPFPFLVHESEK